MFFLVLREYLDNKAEVRQEYITFGNLASAIIYCEAIKEHDGFLAYKILECTCLTMVTK